MTMTTTPSGFSYKQLQLLKRMYSLNHEDLSDFQLYASQYKKTIDHLKQNPSDIRIRTYYVHLLAQLGAAQLIPEQIDKIFAQDTNDIRIIYSLWIELKKFGLKDTIDKYPVFKDREKELIEIELSKPIQVPHTKRIPIPKKHLWERQKYREEKEIETMREGGSLRHATIGEVEFLTAQLNEQKW